MEDGPVTYGKIRQQTRFTQAGDAVEDIIVPIFIGTHGPFTERFTQTEYNDGVSVQNRVNQLRAALQRLPK